MLMLVALMLFLAGTRWYVRLPPQGACATHGPAGGQMGASPAGPHGRPIRCRPGQLEPHARPTRTPPSLVRTGDALLLVVRVLRTAVAEKWRRWRTSSRASSGGGWLEAAVPRWGDHAVEDVRTLLSVLTMFTPVPLFWTLFDQTSSRQDLVRAPHHAPHICRC